MTPTSRRELHWVYRRLDRHFGDLHWWPGETAVEICVGAILTQNTSWSNVNKAISRLKESGALSLRTLGRIRARRLATLIRSSGYFNVKTRRLKDFVAFVHDRYGGSLSRMLRQKTARLRAELLAVPGIGPETADSILLYAAGRPVFVIDAYTKRVLARHGVLPYAQGYEAFQRLFQSRLPANVPLYNQYHALFVNLGKEFCRKKPRCGPCPLNGWRGVPPIRSAV